MIDGLLSTTHAQAIIAGVRMVISMAKVAALGALIYVTFFLCLRFVALGMAKTTGGVGFNASRSILFVACLLIWIGAFALAYLVAPPMR